MCHSLSLATTGRSAHDYAPILHNIVTHVYSLLLGQDDVNSCVSHSNAVLCVPERTVVSVHHISVYVHTPS